MPSVLSHKRFHAFGALSADGFYCAFYDRAGSDNFIDFLGKIHKKFGRVLILADNASYHKSAKVRKAVKRFNGDVVIRYFPRYTPELNPAEGQWRNMRRQTANRLYESAGDMKKSIRKMLRTGEIITARMSDYLV